MYDGTLASKGPWQAIVTFQQLIVLATQDGTVDMTADAIARRTSIPLEIITAGIEALMQPDPDSRTPDEDGRRIVLLEDHRRWGWRIVNHAKYRDIRRAEERREYLRLAQAKSRAAKKGVNTGQHLSPEINTSTNTEADTDTDAGPPAEAGGKAPRKRSAAPPKPRRVAGAGDVAMPVGVTEQTWRDWCELRAKKKAPVTATVVERAIGEAETAKLTLEEFLQVWCFRGSQGLQAEWLTPNDLARLPGRNGGHVNKQAALEASNAAVGDAWLKKQMGEGDHASE